MNISSIFLHQIFCLLYKKVSIIKTVEAVLSTTPLKSRKVNNLFFIQVNDACIMLKKRHDDGVDDDDELYRHCDQKYFFIFFFSITN